MISNLGYLEKPLIYYCPVCQQDFTKSGNHQGYCSGGCAKIAAMWWRKTQSAFNKMFVSTNVKLIIDRRAGDFQIKFPDVFFPSSAKCNCDPYFGIQNQGLIFPTGRTIIRESVKRYFGGELGEYIIECIENQGLFSWQVTMKSALEFGVAKLKICEECELCYLDIEPHFGFCDQASICCDCLMLEDMSF